MRDLSEKGKRLLWAALPVLVAANAYLYTALLRPPLLVVSVLPVESGRAVLVRAASGEYALIDAGADASVLRALGEALPEWQRTLRAVILTSPRADYAGGLPEVLTRYRVAELIRPRAEGSRSQEAALAAAAAQNGTSVHFANAGESYALGQVRIEVAWPPETPSTMGEEDGALDLTLSYGSTSVRVRGDLRERTAGFLEATLPREATVVIGTSTAPHSYVSDGESIHDE